MSSPKLRKNHKVVECRMKLADPVAETELGKRMLDVLGPDDFQVLRTFQQEFGARLVWFRDGEGEVGKKPEYVSDAG